MQTIERIRGLELTLLPTALEILTEIGPLFPISMLPRKAAKNFLNFI
jgi:hypothetical protein